MAVLVAISRSGMAACRPMSGTWNNPPIPIAATNGYKIFSALHDVDKLKKKVSDWSVRNEDRKTDWLELASS